MSNTKEFILKSIFGGILISLGGFVYVSSGMSIIGAILFAFGLISVVLSKSNLFTGKSGFCETSQDFINLLYILILNIIGCFAMGYIGHNLDTSSIVYARLNKSIIDIFLLSVGTGMIMTIAVNYAKQDKWLPLLFGVPLFIICGMPHCIADAFYYSSYFWSNLNLNSEIFYIYFITIFGNFIGCLLPTKIFNI